MYRRTGRDVDGWTMELAPGMNAPRLSYATSDWGADIDTGGSSSDWGSSPTSGGDIDGYPLPTAPGSGTAAWDQMHDAIYQATPTGMDASFENTMTDIAVMRDLEPSHATATVRAVWNATPTGFGNQDNAVVMGAALLGTSGSEAGDIVRRVWNETPTSFTNKDNAALMATALLTRIDGDTAERIIDDVWARTPSSYSSEQNASLMMGEMVEAGSNPHATSQFVQLVRDMS